MTSAPRILSLSASKLATLPLHAVRELGFGAVALTDPALAMPPPLAADLREAGLALITALPADAVEAEAKLWHDLELGASGFLATAAHRVPAAQWRRLIRAARGRVPDVLFIAEMLGEPAVAALGFRGVGFDYLFNSVRWWDGTASWFFDQQEMNRHIAASVGFPELPGAAETDPASYARRLTLAATLSAGLIVNDDVLDRPADRALVAALNRLKTEHPALRTEGPIQRLNEAGTPVTIVLRESVAGDDAVLIAINNDEAEQPVDIDAALGLLDGEGRDFRDLTPGAAETPLLPAVLRLAGREIRLISVKPAEARIVPGETLPPSPGVARVIVERVLPELDGGRFPVKRIVGDRLEVSADIFRDGHDKIAASLWVQGQGAGEWRVTPMRFWDNDRWIGSAPLDRIGETRFAVAAWTDHFASWRDEVTKKRAAGNQIALELIEGRHLIETAAAHAAGRVKVLLQAVLSEADKQEDLATFLLSNRVAHAMARVPDWHDLVFQTPPGTLRVDREAGRFSAWYGMFPRSQGHDPNGPANFRDCIERLPEIREMGFDVLYLVPIHPIGRINRKGRNNSVTSEPGEPGSPYAIGSEIGGHTAIDPELGTLEDFRAFVRASKDYGLEIALDFAIQCAPDHPWLKQHPSWFKRRPDGTMKYAENPPKKYQDIVNVDFDQTDWPSLWAALLDTVRFWVAEGVKIFRVDNPHTKPVAFWQWLIAEVQRTDPDVLFLAEAFTRPKMMQRLAKVGFSQSYTYFTWRNTKEELTQYLTELTTGEQFQYYRPNFFPNTPDILPFFLQQGGRPAFRIRLVLAATLSPAYGIYNGFELCENRAVPGREEYIDSEKYQYKVWDWDRPGNIKPEIAAINRLRRASPALRLFDNLRFHDSSHGEVLFYSKIAPDRSDAVLVAVTMDPHHVVRTEIEFPLAELGLPFDGEFETRDAFTGEIRRWSGAKHWIVLDPETFPALVLHFRPEGHMP